MLQMLTHSALGEKRLQILIVEGVVADHGRIDQPKVELLLGAGVGFGLVVKGKGVGDVGQVHVLSALRPVLFQDVAAH